MGDVTQERVFVCEGGGRARGVAPASAAPVGPGGAAATVPPASPFSGEFLRDAGARLGVAALVFAATFGVGIAINLFLGLGLDWWIERRVVERCIVYGALLALSLGVVWLARSGKVEPGALLSLGLGYEVVGALGISLTLYPFAASPDDGLGPTWLGVWVVVFPLLVPTVPWKSLLAALASTSTAPLVVWVGVALGDPAPSAELMAHMFISNYVCAGVALAPAYVAYGWGRAVTEARRLGSYRLVERLGHGAMGEVWRAEHCLLARPAAVKLVRAAALTEGDREAAAVTLRRFEREARVTSSLRSAHTIALYDFGLSDDGNLYYVMELLDGLDLHTLVRKFGAQEPNRIVCILAQVCSSLAEAHANGLIHRDVKPANIFLCRMGVEHDFVKVLDFGLVTVTGAGRRTVRESEGRADDLTVEGLMYGTPAYMAPEQAIGRKNIDARADIYAVGCVAYYLVTGQPVFEGQLPIEIATDHVHRTPVAPSDRTDRPLPPDLESLILACLEKDPARRPQTAEDLKRRLLACDVGPRWTDADAASWWGEHMPAKDERKAAAEKVPAADERG